MKIIVTGGCGFIGGALVRYLLKDKNISVLNIDSLTYAANPNSLLSIENNQNYSFAEVDICDFKKLERVFNDFEPDAIMHLAAESHVDRSIEGPWSFINTNIIGTYNLLEVSRKYIAFKKNFKFHHISTDEVYGDLGFTNNLFTEDSSYDPSSPYSASKASSDHLVRAWGRTFKLPFLITNCSNNYGPFHFPEKLIPHIILSAINGRDLPIYGDGSQVRDWLYVDDHVKALKKVLFNGSLGETYNIGGNNEMSNLEVVECICSILETVKPDKPDGVESYKDLIKFVENRPGHDNRYAIDASKIRKELDWEPDETFDSGLQKTVKWYLENEYWWKEILSDRYRLERIGKDEQ